MEEQVFLSVVEGVTEGYVMSCLLNQLQILKIISDNVFFVTNFFLRALVQNAELKSSAIQRLDH